MVLISVSSDTECRVSSSCGLIKCNEVERDMKCKRDERSVKFQVPSLMEPISLFQYRNERGRK